MSDVYELDPNLREYATDREWKALTAWAKYGSKRKAAQELGVSDSTIQNQRRSVRAKAARAGYISPKTSQFHMHSPVPDGFVLKGQSSYVDGSGRTLSRWDKTKQAGMEPEDAQSLPDPKTVTKLSTMTDQDGKVVVQWRSEKPDLEQQKILWEEFAKELSKNIKPVKAIKPPKAVQKDLLAGYPVGDHHLGMYSWHEETGADWNIEEGERMLTSAVNYLMGATSNAENAVIAFLGDFLHYDNFESVTPTSRNALDSDTRYPKMVQAAVRTMRHVIDTALKKHQKVHVIIEIGNHDLSSSIFLQECLRVAYEQEPRVYVDTSPMHYHYYRFGKVLLGTHHGHGTHMKNLPLTMAADRPEDWGATDHRYFWTGHVHHSKVQPATQAQDFSGCTVESFRVLPPTDAWAHQKGYRPIRDMKAILYHKNYGEMARHTVNPMMLVENETPRN